MSLSNSNSTPKHEHSGKPFQLNYKKMDRKDRRLQKLRSEPGEIYLKSDKKCIFKRFLIYEDRDVGFLKETQMIIHSSVKKLLSQEQDEDNSSSDELISNDISRLFRNI